MTEAICWSIEKASQHLEVRPADRIGDHDGKTVVFDGLVARAQRDWVYWRFSTACTKQEFEASSDCEISVRLERGDARIGFIDANAKLGENWCDPSKIGKALYVDTFFGAIRSGDQICRSSSATTKFKAATGDVISAALSQGNVTFRLNNTVIGAATGATGRLRFAVQLWDKGDAVRLVGPDDGAGPSSMPVAPCSSPTTRHNHKTQSKDISRAASGRHLDDRPGGGGGSASRLTISDERNPVNHNSPSRAKLPVPPNTMGAAAAAAAVIEPQDLSAQFAAAEAADETPTPTVPSASTSTPVSGADTAAAAPAASPAAAAAVHSPPRSPPTHQPPPAAAPAAPAQHSGGAVSAELSPTAAAAQRTAADGDGGGDRTPTAAAAAAAAATPNGAVGEEAVEAVADGLATETAAAAGAPAAAAAAAEPGVDSDQHVQAQAEATQSLREGGTGPGPAAASVPDSDDAAGQVAPASSAGGGEGGGSEESGSAGGGGAGVGVGVEGAGDPTGDVKDSAGGENLNGSEDGGDAARRGSEEPPPPEQQEQAAAAAAAAAGGGAEEGEDSKDGGGSGGADGGDPVP